MSDENIPRPGTMLALREPQLDGMLAAQTREHVQEAVAHVRQCFPDHAAALGAQGTRAWAEHALARAAHHGLVELPDALAYLEVMCTLGRDFDVDPKYPWAAAILRDPAILHPSSRAEELVHTTLQFLEQLLEQPQGAAEPR
ncbi:MAG: hypothetical protein U0168_05135 [Nannocystaceae bacterium]